MKTAKRDSRKPEIAIYRPGMGLQGKSKNEDKRPSKSRSPDSCILDQMNNERNENLNENNNGYQEQSKTTKNGKNRRPDLKVYTPKPKIAQLNNKKNDSKNEQQPPVKDDSISKGSRKKSPNLDVERRDSKRNHIKVVNKSSHPVNSNNPSVHNDCNDDINESDVSNSRSSPEKLPSYKIDDTVIYNSAKEERNKKSRRKQRFNSGDSKKYVSIQNQKTDTFLSPYVSNNDLPDAELNSNKFVSNEKTGLLNCDEKVKYSAQLPTERNTISHIKHNAVDSKAKFDRQKRPITLPPRFLKNKNQHQENQLNDVSSKYDYTSSTGGGGGILKLPVDFDRAVNLSEPVENSVYIPKMYQEQIFIHKTLFDPNNPSKPEVINIPAPHSPHIQFCNFDYSESSSFMTHSIKSMGYIPPPQPPTFYEIPSINANRATESFLNKTEIIPAPVPVPVPAHAQVYCRSSISFPEMTPVLPETGKKRYVILPEYEKKYYVFPETEKKKYILPKTQKKRYVLPETLNRRLKPIVESNLREIFLMERELSTLLAKGFNDDTESGIHHCRSRLQFCYADIILADPTYCAERNPEQSLWRTVFHQIIELYRKQLDEKSPDYESTKEKLLDFIFHGAHYFKSLIEQLEQKFGFEMDKLLVSDNIVNMSLVSERVRVVLISVQKMYVYLGDLARYKEQVSHTSNYAKARSCYQKASQILPKNGRPYYQLALVSISTRRKLDAVYYYIRSLATSNPILSAKESLLTLFEEVKRKYDINEKKRTQETPNDNETLKKAIGKRVEVWIKPDGSSNQRPYEMENNLDSSDVKNLSDAELNKRFITSFLHAHGKLFTKVGMESFPDTLTQMLKEFYFLLQRTPLPITSSRLMQLLAINIFSVDNSSSKETGREHGGFSLLQEQALYASMAMMSILMERCHMLYIAHKSSPDFTSHKIGDDLAELLPSVKIWTDWMSCQKFLWAPPPKSVLKELNICFVKDIWTSFADLLTVLREIDIKYPKSSNTKEKDCDTLVLPEDNAFAGFVPLLEALQDPVYVFRPYDKVLAKHGVRINRIQFFGDYLCGIANPCMQFDIESKKFVSLMDKVYSEESFEGSVVHNSCDDTMRDDDIDENLRSRSFLENDESNELQILWSKKEKLSKTKEQQEKYKAEVQAVLRKHESQRPIVLKIQPKFLIPDTNCFIDHLRLFRNIITLSNYHLIVPLVVINELDGLARGTRVNEHTSPEHANRVTLLSREAVHFLEEQFAQRNPHVKAITSKGSILDTISFRSEEMGKNKGTNDDLILSCCLYYCKDRPEDFMPQNPDEPVTLFREVVLLTDDRNLCVKALAHHVPVRDLQSFLQWVNS